MTDAQILDRIFAHEGLDYTNDPIDRGSCSKFGITRRTLQEWRGKLTTCEDVKALQIPEAEAIYVARYIQPFEGVDESVKPQVVDIAVNSGVLTARTLLALAQQGPKSLNTELYLQRMRHYIRLIKARPEQMRFLHGWFNRASEYL